MIPKKCPKFKNTCQRKERQILEEIVLRNYMKNTECGKQKHEQHKDECKGFCIIIVRLIDRMFDFCIILTAVPVMIELVYQALNVFIFGRRMRITVRSVV